jgi:hypothetical protein
MATYSFLDVGAALSGPGGNINLGMGAAVAEEGITIERIEDANTLSIGADGEYMHSLHAGRGGIVRVRLLKTSPGNSLLQTMLDFQRLSGANWGQNNLSVRDFLMNDVATGQGIAFTGPPSLTWGKVGGINEWVFQAGKVHIFLGAGVPVAA